MTTHDRDKIMSKERGFYNLDLTGIIYGTIVISTIVGFLLYPTISWLWGIIKPWIHGVTA